MTGGVVVLIAILLLAITGASITYRAFTEQLLGVDQDKSTAKQAVKIENNWQGWLEAAYAEMPEGAELQQIRFPRQPRPSAEKRETTKGNESSSSNTVTNQPERKNSAPEQILTFQFHASGDWLGLAGSTVKIDKQQSVLDSTVLFANLALGEKIFAMLKPLHTGHHLPAYYVLLLLLLSLLGTTMVFSGLVSFIIKKRKRINVDRWMNSEPLTES